MVSIDFPDNYVHTSTFLIGHVFASKFASPSLYKHIDDTVVLILFMLRREIMFFCLNGVKLRNPRREKYENALL